MKLRKSFQISIALFCVLMCREFSAAQEPSVAENTAPQEENLIHFGDLIDVDVLGSVEYDWRGRLSPEGFLSGIEYIEEPVYGLCRSEQAVSLEIAKSYEKLLREPKVVVRIIDRSARAVSLLEGAVKKPQRFQIKRLVKLNELLIVSGGLTDRASGEIRVFRPENLSCAARKTLVETAEKSSAAAEDRFVKASQSQGAQIFTVAVADLLSGKTEANPQILSGDIVTVLEAAPIYITGGVNSPKQISSRTQSTLSRAIDSAGGLTKEATENSVLIFRRSGSETKVIEADLEKIKANLAEDIPLQGYDVIEVGQKGIPRKKYPPVIQNFDESENKSSNLPLRVID